VQESEDATEQQQEDGDCSRGVFVAKEEQSEEVLEQQALVVFYETMVMVQKSEDGEVVSIIEWEHFETVNLIEGEWLQVVNKLMR
jgi:hypothetical protein